MATPVGDSIALSGDALIDGLVQGGAWVFSGPRVMTYSLNVNDDGSGGRGPGGEWTLDLADAFARALAAWSNVADLSFERILSGTYSFESTADISATLTGNDLSAIGAIGLGFFPDPEYTDLVLAGTGSTRADYPQPEGDVLFDDYYSGYDYLADGGFGFEAMVHEVGHALGLKHPSDGGGNGRPTFAELGIASYDAERYTIMSLAQSSTALDRGHVATPMPLDILAIQHIYGANFGFHAGNDVYALVVDGALRTIWDAGGIDRLDASAIASGITLDLRPGALMDIGPATVLGIAYNCTIENATGGAGNDTLWGNDASNVLDGSDGADTLRGGAGDDTYMLDSALDVVIEESGAGDDTISVGFTFGLDQPGFSDIENLTLTGSANIDANGNHLRNVLTGNAGANRLHGYNDADTMIGGAGPDRYVVWESGDVIVEQPNGGADSIDASVSYTIPLNVELLSLAESAGAISGTGNSLANSIGGNAVSNTLLGRGGNDTLSGGDGDDVLRGDAGDDRLLGGAGTDWAYYDNSASGVQVALAIGAPQNTIGSGTDSLSGIENLLGSRYDDSLKGNGAANTLQGNAGNDTLIAGAANDTLLGGGGDDVLRGDAGDDNLNGGLGIDWAYYSGLTSGVAVDLALTAAQNTMGAGIDTLLGIERLLGSGYDDFLGGNNAVNVLRGESGNDTLDGARGMDSLSGGAGADLFTFSTALNSLGNVDRITDFNPAEDEVALKTNVFTAAGSVGPLAAAAFHSGAGVTTATDADDRILYNTSTGNLYYDADGAGGAASILFATLSAKPAIGAEDFLIVA